MQDWSKKSSHGGVVVWWWCGGVVYLTDYRTTPGCSTLFYSVQLWIVAIADIYFQYLNTGSLLLDKTTFPLTDYIHSHNR